MDETFLAELLRGSVTICWRAVLLFPKTVYLMVRVFGWQKGWPLCKRTLWIRNTKGALHESGRT